MLDRIEETEVLQEIADRLTKDQRRAIECCFKNRIVVSMLKLSSYHGAAIDDVRRLFNQMLDYAKILCGDSTARRGDRPTIECLAVDSKPDCVGDVEIDIDVSDLEENNAKPSDDSQNRVRSTSPDRPDRPNKIGVYRQRGSVDAPVRIQKTTCKGI